MATQDHPIIPATIEIDSRVARLADPAASTARVTPCPAHSRVDFGPALTKEQVDASEASYNTTWGAARRITMLTLTRSRDELADGILRNEISTEDACQMLDQIEGFRDHLSASVDLANAAIARIIAATVHATATQGS